MTTTTTLPPKHNNNNNNQPVSTICVHCTTPNPVGPIVRFSDSSVSLTRCPTCHQYIDPYVELELVLICIDMCLHRMPAYIHVIRNRPSTRSYLVRFALLTLVVDSNAIAWVLNSWSPATHFLASLIGFTSSTMFAVILLSNYPHELVIRSLLLGRFPTVLLFTIASAWDYSSEFQNLIAIFSFTVLIASLHTFLSLWRATIVAVLVSLIRVLPFFIVLRNET